MNDRGVLNGLIVINLLLALSGLFFFVYPRYLVTYEDNMGVQIGLVRLICVLIIIMGWVIINTILIRSEKI